MAEVLPPVTLVCGGLSNKQNPMRLGIVDPQNPVISKMTRADNVDIDDNNVARLRQGLRRVYTGTPHSMWCDPRNNTVCFFIEEGALKWLIPDFTAITLATFPNNYMAAFEPVNDDTVMTNGDAIGWVSTDGFTPFAPTLGEFEATMPAGQFLCFYNGVLYVVVDGVIYMSKPYRIEVYDVRFGVFPLPAPLRMIGAVEDGVWLSTTQGVVFLRGGGMEDFVYVPRTKPAYYGAFYAGYDFSDNKVVGWVSEDGILLGRAGGQIERVTPDDVVFPKGTQGRLFKTSRDGIDQWVAVIHNPLSTPNYSPPSTYVTELPGF